MPAERILFRPLSRRGMGSGHLRRCWTAAGDLGERALILLDGESDAGIPASEWSETIAGFPGAVSVAEDLPDTAAENTGAECAALSTGTSGAGRLNALVVFDRRSTAAEELEGWEERATPVLLDDIGTARETAPYLIDTIPGDRDGDANLSDMRLMDLPDRRREPAAAGPVLVSFGGHDPAGLTVPAIVSLISSGLFPPSKISATLPYGVSAADLPEGVESLGRPDDLKNRLGDYGLVACSYGLTAWEAVAAGCAVVTVDPTPYHESLSRKAGFPGLGGFLDAAAVSFGDAVRSVEEAAERLAEGMGGAVEAAEGAPAGMKRAPAGKGRASGALAALLGELDAPAPRCAACGLPFPPVVARFPERTYYRCPDCGITGLYRFRTGAAEYGPSYFGEEYRRQYGKTYLEDFEHIKAMAAPRLKVIAARAPKGGSLLDIGCAFGPFLDAARGKGFDPRGMDVSAEGVAHVRDVLGITAATGSFPADDPAKIFGSSGFDVVTLWYVIEHFPDLHGALEAASSLVRPGGVLAVSTPNGAGVSGRRCYRDFLADGPEDHYTVWTPRTARTLLARHGFRVYRIRATGHHPERFGSPLRSKRGLRGVLMAVSRIFRLGDTFEAYAVKEA